MLSPILFNLFVNDLPAFIAVVQEGVQFGESLLSCLLYADDLVILAENEETMQALLKKVGDWCSVWGISVNSNKSAILHFRQPTLPLTDAIFTLGVMQIPIVKRYTYLGIIVDEFTTYHDTVQAKIEKATGAFYAMVAQLRQIGDASHRVYKNLFDSMIAPVLDYGAPVWSRFAGNRDIEKVQNLAYRYFLGVGRKHPLAAASGDMCWMPTKRRHQLSTVMFWIHLLQLDNERIAKKVYNECKRLADDHNKKNWAWEVKSILNECGLQSWWCQGSCDGLSLHEAKHLVTCCLFHLQRENWKDEVATKPKLRSYVTFKSDYKETEGYVERTRVKADRSLLAHLRGGTAPLQIEIGRYVCLPVEERKCKTCNTGMVEDEQHFCVGCPSLKKARGPLLRRMEQAHPGFAMLKDNDKFVRIVQQANLDSHIAKLLYIMFINRGVH